MERALISTPHDQFLAINAGSSSLKIAVFDSISLSRTATARAERIGSEKGRITFKSPEERAEAVTALPDHVAALAGILKYLLDGGFDLSRLVGIGHRVVHGGPNHTNSQLINAGLLDDLATLEPFDPEHLPAQLTLIKAAIQQFPQAPQVVCFDTAFHDDLPAVARRLPIPRKFDAVGVRRYGFHGLSFSYLMERLKQLGGDECQGRVILAHLGNGSSLAAVQRGRCIDTSMALTPAAGVPMGTRSGDLDPGLIAYLERTTGMTLEDFNRMVHSESGLLGVSETTGDMKDLLERASTDPRAAEAVELYCYHVRKWIGGFAAALGGLDTLVFSGGIGERSPDVRQRVCKELGFLGVGLDLQSNQTNAPVISIGSRGVKVRVIPTDEEQVIAREVGRIVVK